jgi:hypothetical protein
LHAVPISHMCAICLAHFILLDLMVLIIFIAEWDSITVFIWVLYAP